MTRTPIALRSLPDYSPREERLNTISHMIGILLGILVLSMCVGKNLLTGNLTGLPASVIYGVSMILLYTASTLYHGCPKGYCKKVLQVIDHCTIYFLIVGSFAPVCLTRLMEEAPATAWGIFGGICAISAVGILFTAIDFKKYALLSMVGYLSPWLLLLVRKELTMIYPMEFMTYMIAGGAAYTLGAILYGTKKPYMHAVFHVLILAGSIIHFVGFWKFCI